MTYIVRDHHLDDIDADARDANDLMLEGLRQQEWDNLTAPDGDVSEVIEVLSMEGCEEVAALLRAIQDNRSAVGSAIRLASKLNSIAHQIVENRLENR